MSICQFWAPRCVLKINAFVPTPASLYALIKNDAFSRLYSRSLNWIEDAQPFGYDDTSTTHIRTKSFHLNTRSFRDPMSRTTFGVLSLALALLCHESTLVNALRGSQACSESFSKSKDLTSPWVGISEDGQRVEHVQPDSSETIVWGTAYSEASYGPNEVASVRFSMRTLLCFVMSIAAELAWMCSASISQLSPHLSFQFFAVIRGCLTLFDVRW